MYTRRYLETSLQNFQRILLHPRILYIAKLVKSQKLFCYSTNEGVNEKKNDVRFRRLEIQQRIKEQEKYCEEDLQQAERVPNPLS